MKIKTIISLANKGKYIYAKDKYLGEVIWSTLNEALEIYKDNENYNYLKAEAKKHYSPEEWLMDAVHRNLELPTDFAKNLQRYDTIYPRIFKPKNKIGEAIIDVMEGGDMVLILYNRTWLGTEELNLWYYLCHLDHRFKLQADISAGKIIY